MKLFKIIILIAFLFLPGIMIGQFNLFTELGYIQHINNQGRKDLIKDNIDNAEKKCDELLLSPQTNKYASFFYAELGVSYFLIKDYEKAMFSILRQRILVPNDSVSNQIYTMYVEVAYRLKMETIEIDKLWSSTISDKIPAQYYQRLQFLLKKSIELYEKQLRSPILKIGEGFKYISKDIPLWYNDWEFLTLIKIGEKDKKEIIDFSKTNNVPVYQSCSDTGLRKKIYRKSVKYYLKAHNFSRVAELREECKEL